MGIKKPSDYFKKESKDNENLIGKPNLSSYSEAFNSFKENLSKFLIFDITYFYNKTKILFFIILLI